MTMTVEVSRNALLATLEENRAKHRAVFEAAVDGYRLQAMAWLEDQIETMTQGRMPELYFRHDAPADHTRDYDRVIAMYKMHVAPTVELDEAHVAMYVQDDWSWKRQFLSTSEVYAAEAVHTNYGKES